MNPPPTEWANNSTTTSTTQAKYKPSPTPTKREPTFSRTMPSHHLEKSRSGHGTSQSSSRNKSRLKRVKVLLVLLQSGICQPSGILQQLRQQSSDGPAPRQRLQL